MIVVAKQETLVKPFPSFYTEFIPDALSFAVSASFMGI